MITTSSKAQMLNQLTSRVTLFEVPELLFFNTYSFKEYPEEIVSQIAQRFTGRSLAIRSSAADEDGSQSALAGEYDSILDVPSNEPAAIQVAIETVIASYERNGPRTGDDEFIVQEMLQKTVMSGVIFTHDLNSGAPYYVINYDDVSGLTDTVTSGGGEYANRTLYIHRGATQSIRSERFQRLITAVKELEKIMQSQFLDIEFALGEDLTPYLLQVRAITTQPNWNRAVAKRIDTALSGIQSFIKTRLLPMTGVYGSTTVLGQMPDWNPAEMIGRAPRALAYSLYKTLITDHAWRTARAKMGYSIPVGQPLMISLAGQPFIDTRLSFHSYLPKDIPSDIGHNLVNTWIQRLKDHPELHDKIEFDVAITTYSFDIDEKLKVLVGDTLTAGEISTFKNLLLKQTLELITGSKDGGIESALLKVELLTQKQSNYNPSKSPDITSLFEMINDCISMGTIPFSILARHGFIAQTLLLSMKERGIITMEDVLGIQSGVRTIASDLVDDMRLLQLSKITRDEFMQQYGYLRPGTYDIRSSRYDQMESIGKGESKVEPKNDEEKFILSNKKKEAIGKALTAGGFEGISADSLLDYIHAAIKGREYGKFVFTRSISEMLQLIELFGEEHGLSRDEMSHIPIDNILDIITKSSEGSIEERLRDVAEEEAEKHAVSAAIRLPQVLFDEAGVHVIPFQVSHPNFITQEKATAYSVRLNQDETAPVLHGKIVLIENADPGFDWIFSQKISGLITKYGGANSHMAIRCAEFRIPAAIGCGEQRFESLKNGDHILLDCSAGLINTLH